MSRWGARWALVAVLLLAFGLRLYRLGTDSLWYDETVSVHLAANEVPAMVAHTAGDIHPPGYYLLLHNWLGLAAGGPETGPGSPSNAVDFTAAFFSVFFGMLVVALAHRIAAAVFGPPAGLLAAFLVAISPYNVWYSQEVRMYTLAAALGTGLLYAVLRLMRPGVGKLGGPRLRGNPWPWLALYALLGALGLWTLYYFAFLLVAINLIVGFWWLFGYLRRRRSQPERVGQRPSFAWPPCEAWLGRWMLAQAAVLLLYIPWIPVAWRQATEPPVPPWRSFTGLGEVLVESWTALSLGQSAMPVPGRPPVQVWPVLLLFAALFALGLLAGQRRAREPGRVVASRPLLLAGHVLLPVLLIYLASLFTPLYHVRYVFPYSTPFYVLLAGGLLWLGRRWRVLAWLSLATVLVFSASSLHAYHNDPRFAADDHRAAVGFLTDRWRPGDAILVNAGYAYPALLHYWGGEPITWRGRLVGDGPGDFAAHAGDGPVLVQAGTVDGEPTLGWGDPESDFYAMTREQATEALERLFTAYHRVWVYRIYDTVTDPEGILRDWLADHGTLFEDEVFGGEAQLRVQGYVTGRDPLAGSTMQHDTGLVDGSLALVASNLAASDLNSGVPGEPSATLEVGQSLDLALVWRVGEQPPEEGAILFAGLFDAAGQRWAQADERPLGPLYPVGTWPPGTLVRTPVRLYIPPATPPGTYGLELGWYRFEEGRPVWLPWVSGHRFVLGEVHLLAPAGGWKELPKPTMAYRADVTIGAGVRLLGFDAPALSVPAGQALGLDLYWLATEDAPAAGPAVLRLTGAEGRVVAEVVGAPAGGLAPFPGWAAGQVVRDPRRVLLATDLLPGVYDLSLGRRAADGTWLPVQRGPFSLGECYPLATVHVLGR